MHKKRATTKNQIMLSNLITVETAKILWFLISLSNIKFIEFISPHSHTYCKTLLGKILSLVFILPVPVLHMPA
jgi:hypothetical protein